MNRYATWYVVRSQCEFGQKVLALTNLLQIEDS